MATKRVGMEGSFAIAEAIKLARAEAIAAYPITPQTHIVERLAEFVANGELDAEYIPVESEHSAMSACLGTSAVGARTFTATASQGLELMHEVLYVASGLRLPIVMTVANRALSAPLSIWTDHSDIMAARDCGWIQIFAENAQQAFDLMLCAFRIAEDPAVLLPTMVNIDGFYISHTIEPVEFLDQSVIDKFLPEYHTDFIFASIAEELGFLLSSFLIIAFLILFWRILTISRKTKDNFGALISGGMFCLLFSQFFINIAMNLGLLPITGITLPLVSYGGSSFVSTMICLGILESVYSLKKKEEPIIIG